MISATRICLGAKMVEVWDTRCTHRRALSQYSSGHSRTAGGQDHQRYGTTEYLRDQRAMGGGQRSHARVRTRDTEDSSAAVNSNDISGARARMDFGIKPGIMMAYASVADFMTDTVGLPMKRRKPLRMPWPVCSGLKGARFCSSTPDFERTNGRQCGRCGPFGPH